MSSLCSFAVKSHRGAGALQASKSRALHCLQGSSCALSGESVGPIDSVGCGDATHSSKIRRGLQAAPDGELQTVWRFGGGFLVLERTGTDTITGNELDNESCHRKPDSISVKRNVHPRHQLGRTISSPRQHSRDERIDSRSMYERVCPQKGQRTRAVASRDVGSAFPARDKRLLRLP